ncbi:hypothetical protein NMY22_g6975 [Coprinellus aureogranulatus]|nr:hypothetical protein NMY22_g6975 [Coprinellus aureogranulatus]
MVLRFLLKLFRRSGSSQPSAPAPASQTLTGWFHVDLHKPDGDASSRTSVAVAERRQKNLLEALCSPFPELSGVSGHRLHEGSVIISVPPGLDLDTATQMLSSNPSFKWKQRSQQVVKDEFSAADVQYNRTVLNAWQKESTAVRRAVMASREYTTHSARQWLESFVSDADPGVLAHIQSSVDMDGIWEHLLNCVNASLSARLADASSTRGLEKEIPSPERKAFLRLGVFDIPGSEEVRLTVRSYLLRAPSWVPHAKPDVFSPVDGMGRLRSEKASTSLRDQGR